MKFYGKVATNEKGITSLTLQSKEFFQKKLLELAGKDVEITVKERKSTRSLEQNALYWKWLTIMGEDLGYTKEELHYVFKKQFLFDLMPALSRDEFKDYIKSLGKELDSTRKLNTKEFSTYLNQIYEQSRELNINLPTPELQGLTDEK